MKTAVGMCLCSACTGGHRVVRLKVVAPASAVQQSTSGSASCQWAASSMSKAPAASPHMRADAAEPSSERAHHGTVQVSCMLSKNCLATHSLGILYAGIMPLSMGCCPASIQAAPVVGRNSMLCASEDSCDGAPELCLVGVDSAAQQEL